jgi:hypothetical protein
LSFGLGFIVGQQHLGLDIHQASFFTQEDAEYVALDVDMDVYHTDSNRTGFGAFNGYGIAYDMEYRLWAGEHHQFRFSLTDVGFIRWDRQPDRFTRDTTFRFDGFEVDLLDFDSPALSNAGDSLLDELIGPQEKGAYITEMPIDVQAFYRYRFNKTRWSIAALVRHRFNSLYRPYAVLIGGYDLKFNKWGMGFYPEIAYGGYGKLNAGLKLAAKTEKGTYIEIGTSGIDALIAPGSRCGLAASLTFQQRF